MPLPLEETGCVVIGDGATIRVGLTIFRFRTIDAL